MRNLLLFLLILFAIWWIRRALNRPRGNGGERKEGGRGRTEALTERVLACEHCGVHVPESEGVSDGSRFFCCEEHRRLGAGRQER